MKIQGTPEEIEQAKKWWAEQKERIDKEYKEAKKKDPNAKKTLLLLALKIKKEITIETK